MNKAAIACALASAFLCSASARAAPPEIEIERLLHQWRIEDAKRRADALVKKNPRQPRYLAALGLVDFYRGEYQSAEKKLKLALTKIQYPSRRLRAQLALVSSTAETVKGFVSRDSENGFFQIRTRPGKDELLIHFAGKTLEAIRARLQRDLGYAPKDKIRVEIYAEPATLARVSPLTKRDIERSGTVALCKYNRLMIVSPAALLRGYGWLDTLAHEYVHLVISRISNNAVPIWLQEGLAKYFETRWRQGRDKPPPLSPIQGHLLADALRKRKLIPWAAMHPSMAKLPSQKATTLAFAQVQTAIAFIIERAKLDGLRQLLAAQRAGVSDWGAVQKITTLTKKGFQARYVQYLRSLKPRRMAGLAHHARRYGKKPTKEQRAKRIKAKKARDFFRLADMLRQRKLTQAAIIEYKKARAIVGDRDATIANALGRAYLEVDNPNQAVNSLLPVLEYYPELAGAQTTVGVAYLRAGNRPAATKHLLVALRINPFNPEVHCGLARALDDKREAARHAKICGRH